MNLFKYVSLMKEQDGIIPMIGVGLLAFFLLFIILKMLGGMRRGTFRQLVRTGMTLAAAIISFIAATIVSNSIIGSTENIKVENLLATLNMQSPEAVDVVKDLLGSFDPELFESFILLPATLVIVPFLATGIFLALNVVLKIVRAIIVKIFKFNKAKTNPQRLGGALLSAIQGIIWLVMITLPFTGLLSLVDNAYTNVVKKGGNLGEVKEFYGEYLEPFTDNPAIDFLSGCGGEAMSNGIATVKIKNEKVNIRQETVDIATVFLSEAPKLKGMDTKNLTKADKKAIDNVIDGLCESTYASNIMVCTLQSVSAFMELDMLPMDTEGDFSSFVDGFSEYLKSITIDTLKEDATTVKDVYYVLSDSGILRMVGQGGDIFAQLQESQKDGDSVISRIINILQRNTRSAKLVKAVTKSLIASVSTSVELEDGTTVSVSYDELKKSMNEVLEVKRDDYSSKDAYISALKESIYEEFEDEGIELEDEVLQNIAEHIEDNYSDTDELTDEEFNDIMLNLYESYFNYLETGDAPDDFDN
ncbi:MAG: hypothetical protein J6V80_04550 [Clostridia bacterium]|nr:hypothetical protein [Clostridia bacterium]